MRFRDPQIGSRLAPRAQPSRLVGYEFSPGYTGGARGARGVSAYRIPLQNGKVQISSEVVFNEAAVLQPAPVLVPAASQDPPLWPHQLPGTHDATRVTMPPPGELPAPPPGELAAPPPEELAAPLLGELAAPPPEELAAPPPEEQAAPR